MPQGRFTTQQHDVVVAPSMWAAGRCARRLQVQAYECARHRFRPDREDRASAAGASTSTITSTSTSFSTTVAPVAMGCCPRA